MPKRPDMSGDASHLAIAPVDVPARRESVGVISDNAVIARQVADALDVRRTKPVDLIHSRPGAGLDQLLVPGLTAIVVELEASDAGIGRLKRICAVGPDAPVIVLMRQLDDAAELSAIEAGADEVVDLTPAGDFNGADLSNAVARALARHAKLARPQSTTGSSETARQPLHAPAPLVLVQEAPDAMVVLDRHGAVAFVNPAAEELLGRAADTLMGKRFDLEIGKGGEITIVQPGGETRVAEVDVVETERGGVPARVASFTDITVRRKLETALKSAQSGRDAALKRSGRFFSRVSHDLRTPLTHIVGFADLLQHDKLNDPVRQAEYAASISDAGRAMLDMVEDLLSVVDANGASNPEPCDLVKLVRNTAHFLQRESDGSGPDVAVDAPQTPLVARIDLAKLQRALYRLVAGIGRDAADGSVMRLSLRQTGKQARLTVRIDGTSGKPVALPSSLEDSDPLVTPADARTGFAAELLREALDAHGGALQLARDGGSVVAAVITLPLKD
ncbi:MAG: histidine kinase dimerization/phospho-acceptor domain-containing protein [Pseudomonadota bacterium]